ncbi:MAG: hypothetical protein K2Q22_13750, partial [Cytophagales bacterium]|nr:hypothetical protein [Cytophagales bacterium]
FEATNNAGGTPKFGIQLPTNTGLIQYDLGNGQSTGGGRISSNWGGNTNSLFLWSLNSSIGTSTPSGSQKAIYSNGTLLGSNSNSFSMRGNDSPFFLSSISTTSGGFNGFLSELIMVNKTVSGFEQKKIESYLALKYGFTLNQSTPTSYVSSDGSTLMWNASNAGIYNNNIAGIGRDDVSGLLQKQSISNNSSEIVTIGLGTIAGTNSLNTNPVVSDLSFLTWANNNGSLSEQSTELPLSSSVKKRLSREWKVQKTGTIGNLQVNFNLTGLGLSTVASNFSLLVDTDGDGDFTTGSVSSFNTGLLANNVLTFKNISFANAQVFTLSTQNLSAGSITGSATVCPAEIPYTLNNISAATGGCLPITYQWQISTDSLLWFDLPTATSVSYIPIDPILQKTWFRRVALDICGNSDASAPITINVSFPPGNQFVYGNNVWNAYAFPDLAWSSYYGLWTESGLNFNSSITYGTNNAPSDPSNTSYQGCQISNTLYSVNYKRKGFPLGLYRIELT